MSQLTQKDVDNANRNCKHQAEVWEETIRPLLIAVSPFVAFALAPVAIAGPVFGSVLLTAVLYNIAIELI